MITPAYVRMMAAYNAEMNRRLYAAAERLGEERRRENCGAFWKSIHGTLCHLYWADCVWMYRIDGWAPLDAKITQSDFFIEDFADLTARRFDTDARIVEWATRIDPAWLKGELSWYSQAIRRDMTRPRSLILTHFFNHQTHHRGQAHALITRFGGTTGDTDLPFVLDDFAAD